MKTDLGQHDFYHRTLVEIANDLEKHYGVEFTETSSFRPGDTGVHGYGRGLDLRCWDAQFGNLIASYVNNKWLYDYTRPKKVCCLYHNSGGGWHIHLQVHPNTRLRE